MDAMVSGVSVDSVTFDEESATVRTQFDQEETPASLAVVATLAEQKNADPVELEPLHSSVDPDALDALVSAHPSKNGDVHVTFRHEGHEITVYSYGVVAISQGDESPAAKNKEFAGR